MGKLGFCRALDCFLLSSGSTCFCMSSIEDEDGGVERNPLIEGEKGQVLRIRDVAANKETLAFQLKPMIVMLKVSMHCNGCARKIEKHVSKMEGVTSYKVDLENKLVTVAGDILPFEVLESVSKVKYAELWDSSHEEHHLGH